MLSPPLSGLCILLQPTKHCIILYLRVDQLIEVRLWKYPTHPKNPRDSNLIFPFPLDPGHQGSRRPSADPPPLPC